MPVKRHVAEQLLFPIVAFSVAAAPGFAHAAGKNGKGGTREGEARAGREGQDLNVQTKIQTTVEGNHKSAKPAR